MEIQGFKSFRERIKLELSPGLTVVVGPNGSGKSNITDAISWCLGEQRVSNLRGSRMEDVIFAGSDQRKPVGMAEVTLTLDNSARLFQLPYEEIAVSRRFYRSGESEYSINKVPCRLKDIHALFMDTGLGRGAYSLIGQGKVDEILSSRPEERRSIIEEAAGIVKYRHRKEEAVRKMQGATQDLNRVLDIISELETRLEPLSLQAEKTRQFNDLQKELRNWELSLFKRDWDDLHSRLKEIKGQLELAKKELNQEKPLYQEKYEETKGRLTALEEAVSAAREQVFELDRSIERQQNRLTLIQDQAGVQGEEARRLQQELQEAREGAKRILAEQAGEQEKLNQIQKEMDHSPDKEWEKQLTEMEQGLSRKQEQQEQLNGEMIDQLNVVANHRGNKNQAADRREQLNQRLKHLERIAGEAEAKKKGLQENVAESTGKISHLLERKKQISLDQEHTEKELKQSALELDSLQKQRSTAKEELIARQSRLKVLEEHFKSRSGFMRPVRELLRAPDAPAGICGTVVDLIKVPAGFETALEAALGGALQNLVTETSNQAKEAIAFLKKRQLGRVTFLPLDSLRPAPPGEWEKRALDLPGIVGLAAKLVEVEPRYRSVVELLLGRLVVADTLENAIKAARRTEQRLRLVTLTGELFHPGGSLSGGGAVKNAGGLLHTRREREQLTQEVQELNLRVEELTAALAEKQRSQQHLTDRLQELQRVEGALELEIQACRLNLQQSREELDRADQHEQENQWEAAGVQEELARWAQRELKAAEDLAAAEAQLAALQDQLTETQEELASLRKRKSELEQTVQQMRIHRAERRQELLGLQKILERLQKELNEKNLFIATAEENLGNLSRKTAELGAQEEQIRQELYRMDQERTRAVQGLAGKQKQREALAQEVRQLEEKLEQLQEQWLQNNQRVHHLELQQERLQAELEFLSSRFLEKGIEDPADLVVEPVANKKQARWEIQRLKEQLEAIGPINPGAEEEYREVTERHAFLLGQKNDLEESHRSLEQLIGELNRLMASQFVQAFTIINKNFDRVFQQLFGGGGASMTLTEEDSLTCGIEIMARPPGKKNQNLSLLSGGERALTAIALLFAILEYKPSPFCVLDEIEASLDEANVRRFADYLANTSGEVQFIVISHRKGTMEKADTLFGVTMDGTGVTQLLSLSLDEYKQSGKRLA
ncbi:chromosome segregation protein SMC [Desulforamulus ruminis]|uniref:chromosome segregation protein SMC n=1 Tax=Desulforamulus ruminis TaxID=1564 RepID=UPI001EE4E2DB|nr:chromosome segregation protein SMC [Desulforamulus ruminis]